MSANNQHPSDEYWMSKAIQLARRGCYTTTPNPNVGCIIVKDQKIVGEGYHQKAGEPHAEVHAMAMAGELARHATAYVTLEPCSHTGRTSPCADALIKAGVSRVVGAMSDPNPLVSGNGFDRLEAAGIDVRRSCLASAARQLNLGFLNRMELGLPHVKIKLAQSLDGRTAMASGESKWITGDDARLDVQYLRAASCAVITGCDSILADDPSMTMRLSDQQLQVDPRHMRQPLRVIIDGKGRLTGHETIFKQAGPILVATCQTDINIKRAPALGELTVWQCDSGDYVDLPSLLTHLGQCGCNNVLVESGARLAGAFIQQQLCHELILYCAPTLLGSSARPLLALDLQQMDQQVRWQWQDVRQLGNDLRLTLVPLNLEDR